MKKMSVLYNFMLVLALVLAATTANAQENMKKSDWQEAMKTATARAADLRTQLAAADKDVADLKAQVTAKQADVKSCEDALFALLGVSRDEWEAYQRDLAAMEKRVAELQGMSDDQLMSYKDELGQLKSKADGMAKSNISKLSRFGTRVAALQAKIDALIKSLGGKEKSYTVGTWARNHDCLWNIAKKPDIYGNAWLWPKIWQGNRDKIKDPDVIKPKWVLRIPAGTELSADEKSAARKYYGKKSSAGQ